MLYGLIGKPLGHSLSPKIHSLLGNNDYKLLELDENELDVFFKNREFKGINVTIPYKEKVMKYLDVIDDNALRIGCVNTIVNRNGKLYGYNTDYNGFKDLIIDNNIEVAGKNILVLGSGGTSKTVKTVLKDLNAQSIKIVSRRADSEKISYEQAKTEKDTNIIVNTTPLGMYPNTAKYAMSIYGFEKLEVVVDVIFNPLKSRLICFAKNKHIKAIGGLKMLVSQAIYAHQLFFDIEVEKETKKNVYGKILRDSLNIVLIGMPGCGKSTVAKYLGEQLGKEVIDIDKEIERLENKEIKDIFAESGEEYFREIETKVIQGSAKLQGKIISTGGGVVKNKKNIEMLRQNGIIIYINRDVALLEAIKSDKRPLAKSKEDLEKLYNERRSLYLKYADVVIKNNDRFVKCAELIKEGFNEINGY